MYRYDSLEYPIDGVIVGGAMVESKNGKWVKYEEANAFLTAMRERAEKAEEQLKVKGEYGYSQFVVNGLTKERNYLREELADCKLVCLALKEGLMKIRDERDKAESDLATNSALLAKQHDRNMELETEITRLKAQPVHNLLKERVITLIFAMRQVEPILDLQNVGLGAKYNLYEKVMAVEQALNPETKGE